LTLPLRRTRHRWDGDSFYTLRVRDRAIGIGLVALVAAVLNPQNLGIVIMLGLIAILLDAHWHPAPSQPSEPARRATDRKPSAKSEG
jgi:hypothetical protein